MAKVSTTLQTLLLHHPIYLVYFSISHKMARNTILVLYEVESPKDWLVLSYLDDPNN